jgi:hypothetical protein
VTGLSDDNRIHTEEALAGMVANSFKNFHVRGFDYICLKRTPQHTRKVYFFDGDVSQLGEVVNPHDHRYDFKTTILSGVMSNSHYTCDGDEGERYQEFEWRTPLNGGDGFTWKRETRLAERQRFMYRPGETYHMEAHEFHTIRMHAQGTVILLDQFEDKVAVDVPTRTFMATKAAPPLDGLYERFTVDEIIARHQTISALLSKLGIAS